VAVSISTILNSTILLHSTAGTLTSVTFIALVLVGVGLATVRLLHGRAHRALQKAFIRNNPLVKISHRHSSKS